MINLYEILKIKEEELKSKRKPKSKHYEGQKIKFAVYLDFHYYRGFYNENQMKRHLESIKFKRLSRDCKICIFERDIKKILEDI